MKQTEKTRREELEDFVSELDDKSRLIAYPLLDEIIFLELRLVELRKLPFIKVHSTNKELQKATPASKMYKECLQQYNNLVHTLSSLRLRKEAGDTLSPLREYLSNLDQKKTSGDIGLQLK